MIVGSREKGLIISEGNQYLLSTYCVLGGTDAFGNSTHYFSIPQILSERLLWVCHWAKNW